ncbi:ProQ/FINO family protein [Ochrobactrum sp. Kaboul]|nr:ProQ/FINO family protein [Ochrobactrum sp. Kaboul]
MDMGSSVVSKTIRATERDLRRSRAIEALLTQPLDVLPSEIGDPIRPVTIGFFQQLSPLLKPEASVTVLRRAIGAYVHSKRYYLSCRQEGAMRHDCDGNPVEPVSDTDRQNAEKCLSTFGQKTTETSTPVAVSPLAEPQSKRDLIRASLLGGNRT